MEGKKGGWVGVDGWMCEWMDGQMDRWIDGWKETGGREGGCGLEEGGLEAGSWVPRPL